MGAFTSHRQERGLGRIGDDLGFTTAGEAARVVVDRLALKLAAKALIDRDCQYDGPNLVIPCGSHAEAIRLVADLRAAVERAA